MVASKTPDSMGHPISRANADSIFMRMPPSDIGGGGFGELICQCVFALRQAGERV